MKIRNWFILIIFCIAVGFAFAQSDTTKAYKNTAVKESKTKKYDDIEQKLWEQNRAMDKLNKSDTIK